MNKAEILRYMRTSSKTQDESILALVDEAVELVENAAQPRTLYRIFDCTVKVEELVIGDICFKSKKLSENLKGCSQVVVFGATLGIECDRLIKNAATTNIAKAMAIQAAAACKIEEVCDELEEKIIHEYNASLRQRFSPGYYDLDISEQKKLFNLLELTKRIGVSLTETMEMLPTKSVTAFIGMDKK